MFLLRSFVLVTALLGTSCTHVQIHGIVRNAKGLPVPDARVTVSDAVTRSVAGESASQENGCICLFEFVKRQGDSFVVRVEAEGYKGADLAFSRRESVTLLVTLAEAADTTESSVHRVPWDEKGATYDLYCVSSVPPGAGGIGLR